MPAQSEGREETKNGRGVFVPHHCSLSWGTFPLHASCCPSSTHAPHVVMSCDKPGFDGPMPSALCPVPCALCPVPCALCPVPCALCPVP
eukprot:357907-Chlamydomonas_euryale.AAC.1